ncbi:hypothetical protein [Aestuariivirga sp.]|jgi:hypothetical protein|uniref:hypothetical protein n=1 Tax=Aestuariivirga sp. TaxID=2650926 RepID=UPI0037836932
MKSLLSAAALLAVIAAPALAEEATGTQAQPAPAVVEIVPTATEPAMTEAPATATGEDAQSKAAMGGHGCGAKKAVYLTN